MPSHESACLVLCRAAHHATTKCQQLPCTTCCPGVFPATCHETWRGSSPQDKVTAWTPAPARLAAATFTRRLRHAPFWKVWVEHRPHGQWVKGVFLKDRRRVPCADNKRNQGRNVPLAQWGRPSADTNTTDNHHRHEQLPTNSLPPSAIPTNTPHQHPPPKRPHVQCASP